MIDLKGAWISMDKSAIKNFAVEARKILMKSAETEAGFYGVTREGCSSSIHRGTDFEVYKTIAGTENRVYGSDVVKRENLVKAVREKGFDQVIEETAYTWFNRIIAIRFMEVNDYLPTRVRVLSSETGSETPDIVTQCLDVDLNMTPDELEKVQKAKDDNRYDEAFRMLFIKQCNELNAVLPGLFEKTDDYMELLLRLSYTSDGVVRMLIDMVDEKNFDINAEGQVEIIGWMYQYYNIEPKAEVFARPSGSKLKKEDIPAATQLFTPDWIVRYMVENSLGRLWVEGHPDELLKENWKYYLEEAEQEPEVCEKLNAIRSSYKDITPESIKLIDPCMGSGHILVYAFDVLMQIYENYGYTQRDAARSILQNNIYGLDIDKRAYQLAYFAVMMKARQYNRRILTEQIVPNLFVIQESNPIGNELLEFVANGDKEMLLDLTTICSELHDAKEYGSIVDVTEINFAQIYQRIEEIREYFYDDVLTRINQKETLALLLPLVEQAQAMAQKYDVVITNPPYMSVSNAGEKMNNYVKTYYKDSKVDLYSVFIEKCDMMLKPFGFRSMITQHGWMFLGSFEKLRKQLLLTSNIINMAHLGPRAFEEIGGEVVQTTVFVTRSSQIKQYISTYSRLVAFSSQQAKEKAFLEKNNLHEVSAKGFEHIPGMPIAYWINSNLINAFSGKLLGDYAQTKQGFATGDNERFLRFWQEVSIEKTSLLHYDRGNAKWFPCNKGGSFRKWYGNNFYCANWANDGADMRNFKGSVIRNPQFYFKEGITWSSLANQLSLRYSPQGFLFESKGSMCYVNDLRHLKIVLGILNSVIASEALSVLSPTLDFHEGPMLKIPVKFPDESIIINTLVDENISISKMDWDAFESSWDFRKHPLVPIPREWQEQLNYQFADIRKEKFSQLAWHYQKWEQECNFRFEQLKGNEEELNRIFIDIYGLQDELTPDVEDKDVTVRRADLQRDIKSLISYAVGCMFGRYSLDKEGLVFAGGNFKDTYLEEGLYPSDSLYPSDNLFPRKPEYTKLKVDNGVIDLAFCPDYDNCIPITDEEYFEDDIVGLFCQWLKTVYGEEKLEENLDFIANALGNKGNTSREIIRNYFLNDFIKDHIKIYQKRPIYWLFDSGKQNGFKALIYMHRYDKDTLNMIRSEYLHKAENAVENSLQNAEYIIQTSASAVERAKATKARDKYVKQLNEMRIYYQALSHLALQKIEIDLDDGVKHNYQLFQGIEVITDGGKKQKVDLLTKI